MNLFRDSIILLSVLLLTSTSATEGKTKNLRNRVNGRPRPKTFRPAPAPGAPKPTSGAPQPAPVGTKPSNPAPAPGAPQPPSAAPKPAPVGTKPSNPAPAPGAPKPAPGGTKPSKPMFSVSCADIEDGVQGPFSTPWLGTSGIAEEALIDLLSVCDGGACEVCDFLEFVHDETEDCAKRVGHVDTFLGLTVSMLDTTQTVVNTADSIVTATKEMEAVFDIIQPVTKGIPYVGPLLKVFNQAISALKEPLQKVASQKDEIEKAKNQIKARKKIFERTEKALDETACVIGAAGKAIHVAKNASSCLDKCVETIPSYNIDAFLENITAGFDVLVQPMGVCNTEMAVSLTLPELSMDLEILEEIKKVVNDIAQFFQDVRDKIINDADMFSCCEDVGIAFRTMGDFFSDLASLVTCAGDGAAAGIIQESLDALLPKLNGLFVEVNKPIKRYNLAASEINSIFFKEDILPKITTSRTPVIEITPCSLDTAALDVELVSVCSGESDSCVLPRIEPLSFGSGDGKFNPEAILEQIGAQCEDSWNNVKDMDIDDCCPAAREKNGIPREGLANGQSCEKWGKCGALGCTHWGSCKSHLCFRGTCEERGKNWEGCSAERPCKDNFDCIVTGKCTDGGLGSPCALHLHCKSSNICGRDWDDNKICIAGKTGDYCDIKCSSGFKCQSVGNNRNQCIKTGSIGAYCSLNDDCNSGYCGKNESLKRVCTSGNNGEYCHSDKNCKSGYCSKDNPEKRLKCTVKQGNGASCSLNDDCKSGYCGKNESLKRVCTSGNNGEYCDSDKNCKSGYCSKNNPDKRLKCTVKKGNGASCSLNDDCNSGYCGKNESLKRVCTSGNIGEYCDSDKNCKSGYCSKDNPDKRLKCTVKQGNGASCSLNDDCSSGYCGKDKSLKRVCTSGNNGEYCHSDKNCRSGYCSKDNPDRRLKCTAK